MSPDADALLGQEPVQVVDPGDRLVEVQVRMPPELRGAKPPGVPHTPWRLLEHLRIAQGDILRFCIDPRHVSPEFPTGYWPEGDAPPDPGAWDRTVAAFRADLKAMRDLVADPATDLFAPLPHGQGQTVLREALRRVTPQDILGWFRHAGLCATPG